MRYINKNDERLMVMEEICTCGHSLEEHQEEDGCRACDDESGEVCECSKYEQQEPEVVPVL